MGVAVGKMIGGLVTTAVKHGSLLHDIVCCTISVQACLYSRRLLLLVLRRGLVSNRKPFITPIIKKVTVNMKTYLGRNAEEEGLLLAAHLGYWFELSAANKRKI